MKKPAFLIGVGSIIQLFPSTKEIELPFSMPLASDEEAIRKDWETVGQDILTASADRVANKK